jgi:hypothetical protein
MIPVNFKTLVFSALVLSTSCCSSYDANHFTAELHDSKLRIMQLHVGMDLSAVEATLKPLPPGSLIGGISGFYYKGYLLTPHVSVAIDYTSDLKLSRLPDHIDLYIKPMTSHSKTVHPLKVMLSEIN